LGNSEAISLSGGEKCGHAVALVVVIANGSDSVSAINSENLRRNNPEVVERFLFQVTQVILAKLNVHVLLTLRLLFESKTRIIIIPFTRHLTSKSNSIIVTPSDTQPTRSCTFPFPSQRQINKFKLPLNVTARASFNNEIAKACS
jgi:hypothetical protein